MSAWVLALFCLVSIDLSLVRAASPYADLAVYLSVDPTQPAAPLDHMKHELSALMQAAGYHILWQDPRAPDRTSQVSTLMVLQLRGSCGLPPGNYRVERSVDSGASLAETSISPNGVQPFSWVNCDNVTRMIGPVLTGEAGAQRDYLYGRAVARVVAHELYHVVTGSRDHGHEGVAKPRFTVPDLLNEIFDFDAVALAKLRQRAVGDIAGEPAVGR